MRHSRILARNIKNAAGESKHAEADSHHVAAAQDKRAQRARTLLFRWGIGINDADNGLYLPKTWASAVPGLEDAGRKALRDIKQDILSNEFDY